MPGHQIEWGSVWRPAAATMVALMLLAGGTRANAQATTATLVGTVTDTTGAALGNATVTITNQSTGQTYVHQTNDSGNYEFTLLPPGVYSMQVIDTGFSSTLTNGVQATVNTTNRRDVQLKAGRS